MIRCKLAWLWFAAILMFSQAVLAHHLWISRQDDVYAVCRGMIPDRLDDYDFKKVSQIKAFGKDGRQVSLERQDKDRGVFFIPEQEISMAVVRCDWGHRVNTTQGKKLMTKKDAEKAGFRVINSFFSTQLAKSLFANADIITMPVNMVLELVPLNNPFEIAKDERFKLRLLFEGKPLADTAVFTETANEIKTDNEGIVHVNIEEKGPQLIWAKYQIPVADDSGLDYQVYTTFLSFEVK
jgi:uncharacterized GH25 family protein